MICVSVRVRTSLFAANMSRANDQRLASDCGKGGRGEKEEGKEKEERGGGEAEEERHRMCVSTEYMLMVDSCVDTHTTE